MANQNIKSLYTVIMIFLFISSLEYSQTGEVSRIDKLKNTISNKELKLKGEIKNISICTSDESFIAFEEISEGNLHDLYIYNKDAPFEKDINPYKIVPFTNLEPEDNVVNNDINWRPVKSQDNKSWFAFVSSGINQNEDVYLGNLTDKNNFIRITKNVGSDQNPRWSPDGMKLVYVSASTGKGDLYLIKDIQKYIDEFDEKVKRSKNSIIDMSDKKHIRLTKNENLDNYPCWSHNSRYIVYSALIEQNSEKNEDLYLLDLSNSDEELIPIRITNTPDRFEYQPSWSPDDSKIAFYIATNYDSQNESVADIGVLNWNSIYKVDESGKPYFNEIDKKSYTILTSVNFKSQYYGPRWTIDSEHLLFIESNDLISSLKSINVNTKEVDDDNPIILNNSGELLREFDVYIGDNIYSRRIILNNYKEHIYNIKIGIPVGKLFEVPKNSPGNSNFENEKSKNVTTFLKPSFMMVMYNGDASGHNFQMGQSIELGCDLPTKFLIFQFGIGLEFGGFYVSNDDLEMIERINYFSGIFAIYLYKKPISPGWKLSEIFINLRVGSIMNSNIINKKIMAGIDLGFSLSLSDELFLTPYLTISNLGANIDRKPAAGKEDKILGFNFGLGYAF